MVLKEPTDTYLPSRETYTAQSNLISRAAYRMPVMARRLIFLATGVVQATTQDDEMIAELKVHDVLEALDLSRGMENYKAVRNAVRNLASQSIEIENDNGDWTIYQWIYRADYQKATDTIRIRISEDLRPFVLELKGYFQKLRLADFGKLQGRHSQRLYEIIMADSGHAGKGGNAPNSWWVRIEKARLRRILLIQENEYRTTSDLRKRVVDDPIKEINEARIGIHITVEYEKKGRELVAFVFHAELVGQDKPLPVNTATQEEEDQERLIELNKAIWEEELERASQQKLLFGATSARGEAWKAFLKRSDLIRK